MRFLGMFAVLSIAAASLSAEVLLTLKSGERYELPQAPKHKNGMVSFTTRDKRFLTVKEVEVAKEENYFPSPPKKKLDRTDTTLLTVSVPPLAPGRYRVSWRVLSVDAHATEGDFSFDVAR